MARGVKGTSVCWRGGKDIEVKREYGTQQRAYIATLSGRNATGCGSAGWLADGAGRAVACVCQQTALMTTGRHEKTLRWRVFVTTTCEAPGA